MAPTKKNELAVLAEKCNILPFFKGDLGWESPAVFHAKLGVTCRYGSEKLRGVSARAKTGWIGASGAAGKERALHSTTVVTGEAALSGAAWG